MTKLNKILTKYLKIFLAFAVSSAYLFFPTSALAAWKNPVIDETLGGDGTTKGANDAQDGSMFTKYFVFLWGAVINLGGLALLIYLIWGAIEWITAGGDSGKIQKARDKITQGVIGLVILVSSFTIIGFLGTLIFGKSFNILEITFPSPSAPATPVTNPLKP